MRTTRSVGLLFLFLVAAGFVSAGERPDSRIIPIDSTGYRSLLTGVAGGPVLVNFWATWCVPCVQEFPDLLKLRESYRQRGLTVLLISIDRQRDTAGVLSRFLRAHGVTFDTYIKRNGNDEGFINAVNPAWSGALPATFIYDSEGMQQHMLIDRQSFESLSRYLQPLLHQ